MNRVSGRFLGHEPCISCNSSDAMAVYEKEGRKNAYCFSCERYFSDGELNGIEKREEEPREKIEDDNVIKKIESLPIVPIPNRSLDKKTCEYFGVKCQFDETTGEISSHFYPYYIDGKLSGYKERVVSTKEFWGKGRIKGAELFGQSLHPGGGKMVVVTEGECDAMAAWQMFKSLGKNYTVVSLSTGANDRSVKRNLEYLESFENVMLCLDQDQKGKRAAKSIADILSPGKAKIMSLSEKDANDMLRQNKTREFYQALGSAKEYRPDGIIRLSQAWDDLWRNENVESVPYPWEGVNSLLYGMRKAELVTLTSGSGMGKSAVVRELEHWIFKKDPKANIGILALEENIGRTAWGVMSIEANIPLHIREERAGISEENIRGWWNSTVGTGRFIAYDHFGSTSENNLINQIRYLIKGMDCKWIFLDHLSIVVSSMEEGGDERRTIDSIMTRLRTLVEETGAGLYLVSHLRRASGDKGHEQGMEVSLSQLRGSQSIAQLSDAVIALERNQQATDDKMKNITQVRVLKNRYAGLTGPATHLYYDRVTGRLSEVLDLEEFLLEEEAF